MRVLHALLLAAASAAVCRGAVPDNEWPGPALIVVDGTVSPKGRYAIVAPRQDAADDDRTNQVADLAQHKLLGKIPGTESWGSNVMRSIEVEWAPDSSWCAAAYYNRLGLSQCSVIELHGDSITSQEIGDGVEKQLDAAIMKQSRNPGEDRGFGLYFRPRGQTLLVRAFGTTNPKGVEGQKTYGSFFSGSYDVPTKKWTKANVRSLDPKLTIGASFVWKDGELVRLVAPDAPMDLTFRGEVVTSEKQREETLDRLLNESYAATRFVVPPARFAKIKEEERAWLIRWGQQKTQQEKNAMKESRVRQLREILWED